MMNVDPIRYAWERCKVHVPFPAALARNATASRVATSLTNVHSDPTLPQRVGALDATRAALHSFVVGSSPLGIAEKMEESPADLETCTAWTVISLKKWVFSREGGRRWTSAEAYGRLKWRPRPELNRRPTA